MSAEPVITTTFKGRLLAALNGYASPQPQIQDAGLTIIAANPSSLLAAEIGGTLPVYLAYIGGRSAIIDGQVVQMTVESMQENRNGPDGSTLTDSALTSALHFADVITDAVTVTATSAADAMIGSDLADRFRGAGGDDFISGAGGDDDLLGGGGNDVILGGEGKDVLNGGTGSDHLNGGAGRDQVSWTGSEAGVSVELFSGVTAGAADGDVLIDIEDLRGTAHDDLLSGDESHNTIYGDAGSDRLNGRGGNDALVGGDGSDTIWGGAGNDILNGGAGRDILNGGAGRDTLDGGDGRDQALYSDSPDGIFVSLGGVLAFWGASGDSLISIEDVRGSAYSDEIAGNDDHNTLYGDGGNDALYGLGGNDHIYGGQGRDTIIAGRGDDRIIGGEGDDVLWGSEGRDTFVFEAGAQAEFDRIEDFDGEFDSFVVTGSAHGWVMFEVPDGIMMEYGLNFRESSVLFVGADWGDFEFM